MPRLDPALLPVVADLDRGLRALRIPFAVVGALVPELLLEARPTRMTNDADVTVMVETLANFESLKARLADFGFARTGASHRMRHHSGGRVDLLPFSDAIAPDGRLELQPDLVLNMVGFGQVVPSAIEVAIDEGPTMPLAPLPLYVLLKLVAFDDRKAPKDLAGIFHCLQHYPEDDERRYGAEYDGGGIPFEYTGAYLLGVDGQSFLEPRLSEVAIRVLDRFNDPASDVVGIVARERGWSVIEDHVRIDVFENFAWYRRGIGL